MSVAPVEAPLAPLSYSVNFCFRGDAMEWPKVFGNRESLPSIDSYYWKFNSRPGPNWILQTYVQLRRRELDVTLSQQLQAGKVNVVYRYDVGGRSRADRCYVVACQVDSARPRIADQTIVQNPSNVLTARDQLVQHWPQPGLIPRDPLCGDRLERLVYKGGASNLCAAFGTSSFRQTMSNIGVEFVIDSQAADRRLSRWRDYSRDDALLAVRDLTEADYFVKPASKLINA